MDKIRNKKASPERDGDGGRACACPKKGARRDGAVFGAVSGIQVLKAVLSCLLCASLVLCASGCKKDDIISNKGPKERVKVAMNQADCKDEDATSDTLLLEGGEKIDVPDEFDDIQANSGQLGSYSYWNSHFDSTSNQSKIAKLWREAGSEFDENGFAMYKGRRGVVMKKTYGAAGDYVDVVYKDGNILHAWLQDIKGTENAGVAWAKYGHGTNKCDVLEFYIKGGTGHGGDFNPDYTKNFNTTPAKARGYEFITGTVDYVVNYGSAFDSDAPSSSADSSSTASNSTSGSDSSSSPSDIKITFHRSWKAGDKIDPTDDFPDDNYRDTGTHDGSGNAGSPNIDKSTINDDMAHGDLKGKKYIVLHSTESNTTGKYSDADEEAKAVIESVNNRNDGVSAHYYVARNGNIYQHVAEDQIAWHAGSHSGNAEEFPEEIINKGMNSYSIGIEIVHDVGKGDYPEEQLKGVDALISYLRGGTTATEERGVTTCGENAYGRSSSDPAYNESTGNEVVDRALAEQGKPYLWGAVGPDSYDCSGLVSYALTGKHERLGTTTTFMEWEQVSDPKPGDICTNNHHCGIYKGDGKMIHAPQTGDVVKVSDVHADMIYVRYSGNS